MFFITVPPGHETATQCRRVTFSIEDVRFASTGQGPCARGRQRLFRASELPYETLLPHEDRHLLRQRHHGAPAPPPRVARRGPARRRLPAGAEDLRRDLPRARAAGGRLSRRLAWAK